MGQLYCIYITDKCNSCKINVFFKVQQVIKTKKAFQIMGVICPWGICPGGICPGGICPRRYLSRGKCPGGKCPGGICPGGMYPGGYMSGGKCPGGTCPGFFVLSPPRFYKTINFIDKS